MTLIDQPSTPTVGAQLAEVAEVSSTVTVRRRTVDTVLIAAGIVVTAVLIAAGALLTWGSNFAGDYVHDELSAQNIQFPDAASPPEDNPALLRLRRRRGRHRRRGRGIRHLHRRAPGQRPLTAPPTPISAAPNGRPARRSRPHRHEGADAATVAELQTAYDEVSGQRNSLLKGETCSAVCCCRPSPGRQSERIAGIAAISAFISRAA